MRKLILLTGEIDSPFFINEIEFLMDRFDKVVVLSYTGDKKKCDEISQMFGFEYEFISLKKSIFKTLFNFMKWCRYKHVKDEFTTQIKAPKGLLKCCYIFWYGIFASRVSEMINARICKSDDTIYLYSYWLSRLAYSISLFSVFRDKKIKKIVSRAHRYDLYEERNSLEYLPFRKFLDESLDNIYFISENGKEYFINKKYSDKSNLSLKSTFYLGTFNKFKIAKKRMDNKKIKIVSCSNVVEVKRIDLIITFIKLFPNNTVEWLHLGDGNLINEIKQKASKELKIKYEFLGRVDNKEVINIYIKENADFFINLSDSEGIPVSIMEALSVGIPVIARNVGGISEIICSGKNGILLDANRVNEMYFAEVVSNVMNIFYNYNEYLEMSQNAFLSWNESFNAEVNYTEFVEALLS